MSDNEMWEAIQEEELPEKYDEAPDKFVERLGSDASIQDKREAWERLLDRAVSGPNKKKVKEFLETDSETAECETDEGPTSLVGTMSEGTTGEAEIRPPYKPMGGITSSTWVSPSTTTPRYYPTSTSYPPSTVVPGGGMGWGTTVGPPTTTSEKSNPAKVEQVPLPPKFTPKVLLAFLDEQGGEMDDKLVWAAHLLAEHFEMRLEDGEIRLVMEFSLRDHYGNNPSTD